MKRVSSGIELMDTLHAEKHEASCIPSSVGLFFSTKFIFLQTCSLWLSAILKYISCVPWLLA